MQERRGQPPPLRQPPRLAAAEAFTPGAPVPTVANTASGGGPLNTERPWNPGSGAMPARSQRVRARSRFSVRSSRRMPSSTYPGQLTMKGVRWLCEAKTTLLNRPFSPSEAPWSEVRTMRCCRKPVHLLLRETRPTARQFGGERVVFPAPAPARGRSRRTFVFDRLMATVATVIRPGPVSGRRSRGTLPQRTGCAAEV